MPLPKPRFAFPSGIHPGVDQAHPASRNLRLSAVPSGANAVNLLTGQPGTPTNSPTASFSGAIGPTVTFSASGACVEFPAVVSGESWTAFTAAAIFINNTSGASEVLLTTNSAAATPVAQLYLNTKAVHFFEPVVTFSGLPAVTLGVPYFAAISLATSAIGTTQNGVLVDLLTGQTWTSNAAGNLVAEAPTAAYGWGGSSVAANQSQCGLAAGMMAKTYLTLPQLQAWAADPWGFWYPNRDPLSIARVGVSSSSNTATLATTEAKDTAAFNASSSDTAALATTEAKDTASFHASDNNLAALATTEAKDTAAFNASDAGAVTAALATTEARDTAHVQATDAQPSTVDTHDGDGWLYHPDTPWMKRWRKLHERSARLREERKKPPKEAAQALKEIAEEAAELIESAPVEATKDAPVAQVDVLPLLFANDIKIEPIEAPLSETTDEQDIAELGRLLGVKFSTVHNSAGRIVAVEEE